MSCIIFLQHKSGRVPAVGGVLLLQQLLFKARTISQGFDALEVRDLLLIGYGTSIISSSVRKLDAAGHRGNINDHGLQHERTTSSIRWLLYIGSVITAPFD